MESNNLDTWSLFAFVLIEKMLPWLTFVLIISTLIFIILTFFEKMDKTFNFSLIFSMAALGGLVGYTTGASITPVLGAILPAILTLIGSIVGYLFGKDSLKQHRGVIAASFVGLLISCVFNVFVGITTKQFHIEIMNRNELFYIEEKNIIEVEKLQTLKTMGLESCPKK